jgi:ferredoxin
VAIEVDIDRDRCMGSGNCVYEAVGAFDLDDDGIAIVVDPDAVDEATLVSAARQCPTQAISVRRDGAALH